MSPIYTKEDNVTIINGCFLPDAPTKLSLWEVMGLTGLEDKWVRLKAKQQRRIMGFPVFGKRAFRVLRTGDVEIVRSTCFGQDYEMSTYTPAMIQAAAESKKQLSPGTFGPGYM